MSWMTRKIKERFFDFSEYYLLNKESVKRSAWIVRDWLLAQKVDIDFGDGLVINLTPAKEWLKSNPEDWLKWVDRRYKKDHVDLKPAEYLDYVLEKAIVLITDAIESKNLSKKYGLTR